MKFFNKKKSNLGYKEPFSRVINSKDKYSNFLSSLPANFSLSTSDINIIANDTTVSSSLSSRKSFSLKDDLIVVSSNSNVTKMLKNTFNYNTLNTALDVVLYGLSVFELNWYLEDGFYIPSPVERDYRNFYFDNDDNFLYSPDESYVDSYKGAYLIKDKNFYNRNGKGIVHDIFWAIKFKKSSIKFWLDFQEKFGVPWIIAKSSTLNKDIMADELFAMFSGDAGVFDSEDNIDIIQPSSNNVDIFKQFIEYCDNSIRDRIVGGNLLGSSTGSSYASIKIQNEIRKDIARSDKLLLLNFIKNLVNKFKELNNITYNIDIFFKDNKLNYELAKRDKLLNEMGFTFDKNYINDTYGVKTL